MEAWETSMTAKSRKGSHLCQSTLSHELADHPFDHPIKPFHQPVGLGLINQTLTTVSHHMAFNVLLMKAVSWSVTTCLGKPTRVKSVASSPATISAFLFHMGIASGYQVA